MIDKLSDNELIEKVKYNQDSDSLLELCKRHEKLCHKMIRNFFTTGRVENNLCSFEKEELLNTPYNIYEAVLSFSPEKNVKFSTYLGNSIKYKCLKIINNKKIQRTISLNSDNNHDVVYINKDIFYLENTNVEDYIHYMLEQFSDTRIKKIFELRFLSDKSKEKKVTWKEIGKELNLSTQRVITLYHKGKDLLRKKYESKIIFDNI